MPRPSFTERRRSLLSRRRESIERLEARNSVSDVSAAMRLGLGNLAGLAMAGAQRGRTAEISQMPAGRSPAAAQPQRRPASPGMPALPRPDAAPSKAAIVEAAMSSATGIALFSDELPSTGRRIEPAPHPFDAQSKASPSPAGSASSDAEPGSYAGPAAVDGVTAPDAPAAADAEIPPVFTIPVGQMGESSGHSSPDFEQPATWTISPGGVDSSWADGLAPIEDGWAGSSAMAMYTNFPVYTLDYNQGVVLFNGMKQIGVPGTSVDLRAQVRDTSVTSYSWNTTNLTHATSISGASTYRLQFNWASSFIAPPGASYVTDTATLTVTRAGGLTEVQTYSFDLPTDGTAGSTGGATWPTSLSPDLVAQNAPLFASHNVAIDANSGASTAAIALPAYNPNVAPVVLVYDSLAADPRPIVVVHHELNPALSVPTKDSAQLTFNGSAGSTYYYDTSQFVAGDIGQFALQANATSLATGRYSYTATVADYRSSTTTSTYTGSTTVINESGGTPSGDLGKSLGAGWTLQGLRRIYAASGGLILDLGAGDSLWFAGAGPTYTTPAGDFSTLVKNGNNTYTRTLKDGTKEEFAADGRESAAVDRNGLRVTYSYDGSGKLTKIADPYGETVTLAYDGSGKLQTVKDPASRVATFTHSGNNLSGVTLPDSASWSYAYDGSGRLTQVSDPRSKVTTLAYDPAGRVGTITRPDATTETLVPYQKRGYDTSGTSGSPAPATLLAEARASHTDARGNVTDLRSDWRGLGQPGQATDRMGYIATADLNANGLPAVTIDRVGRITRFAYDGSGNVATLTYADHANAVYAYNGFSEPTSFKNARGFRTTFAYDGNGNLTGVLDAKGNRTTFTYTGNGRLATAKDARSNVTTYQYDAKDRQTTIVYPGTGSPTVRVGYDAKGNQASITDERGKITTFAYDSLNRILGATDALGNRATYTYDASGNQLTDQEPLSRTTTFAYNSMNRATTVTDPLSHTTLYGYDANGNLSTVSDPLARVTTYGYDAEDRNTTATTPVTSGTSRTATITYDEAGSVIRQADFLNRVTTYTYNSRGWVATVVDPLTNTTTYTYTAIGKISSQSDPTQVADLQAIAYDELDREIAVTDALSHTTSYAYDAVGNRISVTDANTNITTYAYDARNRVTTITDALSHATVYGYDETGNRTTVTDPLTHVTTYGFDGRNRVTTITNALSGVTTMAYDAAGRQSGLTDPVGNRTTWGYDAADRLTTLTDALGTATYTYDAADQLTDQTDRASRRTTFAYDLAGRRTNERWIGGGGSTLRTITYTYDAADQLTAVIDPDATLTYTYDNGGRLSTARTAGGGTGQPDVTLTSSYNALNDRTSLVDNLGSVGRTTYTYDAAHRLVTIAQSLGGTAGPKVDFGYDAGNRMTWESRFLSAPGPFQIGATKTLTTSFTYDAANRLTTQTHQLIVSDEEGTSSTPLATYGYGYDAANRLRNETNAEGSVTYTYDVTDQLTGVAGARSETYGYDANGNRNTTGYTTGAGNKLTASPNTTYTYDAEGNQTARTDTSTGKVTTYSYDHRNRMTGATRRASSGGAVEMQATYTYDALGRRIGTMVDADGAGGGSPLQSWMVYDGVNTYANFNGSGTLTERYVYGRAVDELLARTTSAGARAWYLTDRLGTVRDIADNTATIIYHAAYDSFGTVTSSSGSGGDRFKFTGREYDNETDLQFNRARYYSSKTARWTQQDPIKFKAGDTNLYRYAVNSATNGIDPDGQEIITIIIIIGVGGGLLIFSGCDGPTQPNLPPSVPPRTTPTKPTPKPPAPAPTNKPPQDPAVEFIFGGSDNRSKPEPKEPNGPPKVTIDQGLSTQLTRARREDMPNRKPGDDPEFPIILLPPRKGEPPEKDKK